MTAEILAPAGNFDALVAAVRSGADAVYFGTGIFNARRNADNFDGDGLKKAVDFCHLHSVKCHITLNTLVSDSELSELENTVRLICESGVDAVIVQDLGVERIVKSICPEMEMHASTQLSTGTLEGIKTLADLGFSRAVLPRELSKSEIKYIAENSPIELEVFVHGALCMSVSGQCLLSAMLGSRSGNRGLCAQPCRLPFQIDGGTGTDLSLKDLSLVEYISELADMGIASFKIEGRMKRPEYVSAAVIACRESLDGAYTQQRRNELQSLFSRSGFTDGYYISSLGRNMFGKREKENVTSATTELLKKYEKIYEKEMPVHKVDFVFTAYENEAPTLAAKTGRINAFTQADIVCEKAINRPLTEEAVKTQLEKCGGTVFYSGEIHTDISDGISIPVSAINALRREALAELSEKLTEVPERELNEFDFRLQDRARGSKRLYLCFSNAESIPENASCDRMFLPLDTDRSVLEKYSAGVSVPRGIFGNYDKIVEKIRKSGAKYALCNTLDAVCAAKEAGVEAIGGPFLNVFNSQSLKVLEKLGIKEAVLSYELTVAKISQLCGNVKRGCAVYGRTPLMLTRNCPVKNAKTCAECKKSSSLTDRKGISFPVICENGFSQLLNSRPTYMLDRLSEIKNTDFDIMFFTLETKKQAAEIISDYKKHSAPDGEFTRGLFYRGVE